MQYIDNTIGKADKEILASLKGDVLDAVLVTGHPLGTDADDERTEFSRADVLLRTPSREVLLHLSERTNGDDLYALEITSNPPLSSVSSFSGEHDETGNEIPGWHEIPVGKTICDVQIHVDRKSCTVTKDGKDIPVMDTSVIALTFSESCLVMAKVAFMDNWRVIFQSSPQPDIGGLLNTP